MINKIQNILTNFVKLKKQLKPFYFFIIVPFILGAVFFTYISIPKFFDYGTKDKIIIKFLNERYNLKINDINEISYNIFPRPRLNLKNSKFTFLGDENENTVENLTLVLGMKNLLNYDNFSLNKIILDKSFIKIDVDNFKEFLIYLKEFDRKILLRKSSISFYKKNKNIISFSNLKLNNHKKNQINFEGLLFEKNFKVNFKLNAKKNSILFLKIPDIGTNLKIIFKKESNIDFAEGYVETKVLKNKFNFDFIKSQDLKLFNSFFRNQILESSFNSTIIFDPNFYFNTSLKIKNFNYKKFNNFIKKNYLGGKKLIKLNKRLNGKISLLFQEKKNSKNSFKNLKVNLLFKNGDIHIKNINIEHSDGILLFNGLISNDEGYQKLNYDLKVRINNKNFFLNKMGVKNSLPKGTLNIFSTGSINLRLSKIRFEDLILNNNKLNDEEIKIYKENFEKYIIGDSIFGLFDLDSIKQFTKSIN